MNKPMRWILLPAIPVVACLSLAAHAGLRAARQARCDRNREIASVRAWENEGGALAHSRGDSMSPLPAAFPCEPAMTRLGA